MQEVVAWRPLFERVLSLARRAGLVTVAVVGVVAGGAAALLLLWGRHRLDPAPEPAAVALPRAVRVTTTAPPPDPLVVHVAGAVLHPGLVRIGDGDRVADAIAAAGGLAADADPGRLNLAQRLGDGSRLYVPRAGEEASAAVSGGVAPTSSGGAAAESPLDLNSATEQQLDALPGVGPATAAAIVAHRRAHGRFASVDALGEVRGIGPAKLEALRPLVRV